MAKRLTRYILLALILGVVVGWVINAAIDDGTPEAAAQLKSIADYLSIVTALFLRLIKMIIAPLVFSTLVAGIAHMGDIAALGRIGIRSLLWFILASLVSLTLGLALVTLLHPGVGLNLPLPPATATSGVATAAFNLKDFVSHLVPASIFEAMSTNEILPIVIFSIFFGVALTSIGEAGKPVVRGVESLVRIMLQVTNYVMRFAPLAVFTAVASALAERGPQIFIAQAYGIHLSLGQEITMLLVLMITSKGMAGVPRASLVVIAATMSMFRIPEAGLLLILAVDHFLDMGRSATNVVGNAVAASVVASWEGTLNPERSPEIDTRSAPAHVERRGATHDHF